MEIAFTPHDFAYQRTRGLQGYSSLDDPRVRYFQGLNNSFLAYAYVKLQQKA